VASLFKPMLAAKPDPEQLDAVLAALPYPALFSPKLDGIRATVQNGRLYSRSLKLIPNRAMQTLWGREELDGLDGEIVVGPPTAEDCFNRSTSAVMSRDKSADGAVFHVFDKYSLGGFESRLHQASITLDGACFAQTIKLVPHKLIKTHAALLKYEAEALAAGHEGIMRRGPNRLYKQGRSTLKEQGLIAVKRFVDAEAVVLAVYEQEENTNARTTNELGGSKRSAHKAGKVGKGVLGGFTVAPLKCGCVNCGAKVSRLIDCARRFNIGTGVGLTDAVRAELWKARKGLVGKGLVGKVVKFRYQLIGTKDRPRQPIFLGFRDGRDL
jgi:DNA ligase 1